MVRFPRGAVLTEHETPNAAMARLALMATEDFPPMVTRRELRGTAADVLDIKGVGVMLNDDEINRFVHATSEAAADLGGL